MKTIICQFLFINITFFSITQSNPTIGICVNEVSTDWLTPTNNNLPLDENGNPDLRFLNGFDWVNGDVGNNTYSTNNMFFNENDPYGNMLNVKPLTSPIDYYKYLFVGEQFSPQNGWELLLVNLGRYPDNVSIHQFEELKFSPYIVLYNRYTGIVRVFVAYGKNEPPNLSIDGVKIDFEFEIDSDLNKTTSGLMRLTNGKDIALDKETTSTKVSAVAKNPGFSNRWYSADFQIALDPCTCFYPSRLKFNFTFFSETDFRLVGNALIGNDIDMTTAQDLIAQDFLGSFELDDNQNPENGFIIYKNLELAIDDYIKQLEAYETELSIVQEENKQIKRKKAIAKAFKSVIINGVSPAYMGATAVSVAAAALGGEEWAHDILTHAKPLLEKDSLKLFKLSKEMKTLLGGQLDFFIDKTFKEKNEPTKPSTPSISYSQMSFQGELSNTLDISGIDFMAPGTFDNNTFYPTDLSNDNYDPLNEPLVYKYPIYNEVLGQFALLKSPTINISTTTSNENCTIDTDEVLPGEFLTSYNLDYLSTTQWKIGEKLEYVLNSALNIEDFEILAAIELHGENQLQAEDVLNLQITDSVDNKTLINAESISMEFEEGLSHTQELVGSVSVISKYFPLNAFQNVTSQMEYRIIRNAPPTTSTFPDYCEENLTVFTVIGANLKLIINVTYEGEKTDGSPHEYTYMFTYKIDSDDIDINNNIPLYPNLPGSAADITQYPEDLYLSEINFDGSSVEGCVLNGDTYLCKAWNDVTLQGEFTVAPNYEVKVEAGNEINILAETVTPAEMQFSIAPVLDYSSPMPPATSDYVSNFCQQTNGYQANAAKTSGKSLNEGDVTEKLTSIQHEEFEFNLYPNPTSGGAMVNFSIPESVTGNLYVTDINGRVLLNQFSDKWLSSGRQEQYLSTENLPFGVYLVVLQIDGVPHVKRLVKQ
jgi:hypothetical protein